MRETFDDAVVTGWEELEPRIWLPDADDRHVVAAAVRGGAQGIVTANAKDLPAAAPKSLGLEAVHPDDFLLDQLDLSPPTHLQVIREQAAHSRRLRLPRETLPPFSAGQAFQTSPTRSSASRPPPRRHPTLPTGAAAITYSTIGLDLIGRPAPGLCCRCWPWPTEG
jgi:hypothetical protein